MVMTEKENPTFRYVGFLGKNESNFGIPKIRFVRKKMRVISVYRKSFF